MSGAFAYVGTWTIKPGKLEAARKVMTDHAATIEREEPQLIGFHVFFDEAGSTCSVVQLHPDAASMERHMEVLADHLSGAMDVIDKILSEQYFGGPMSDKLEKVLAEYQTPGTVVTKLPVHVAGFTRATGG
jgi:quinol monooxygenase YgiN